MSKDEKWLAIAISQSPVAGKDQPPLIELYYMSVQNGPFAKDPYPIESITHDIEFIDFSADNNYMVYKEYSGEKTYVEVSGGDI